MLAAGQTAGGDPPTTGRPINKPSTHASIHPARALYQCPPKYDSKRGFCPVAMSNRCCIRCSIAVGVQPQLFAVSNRCSLLPQVYQELLDLVKEEEIKEEKRRSQLFLEETRGSSANSLDDGSDGSSLAESNATNENRDHLQDLYAVPKRNRSDGPRLPPRRVKSSYNRDPNWVSSVH